VLQKLLLLDNIEVDTNNTLSITYASKGVRDAGVLSVNNLRYHTDEILLLKSKKAKFIGDKIYLDYNAGMMRENLFHHLLHALNQLQKYIHLMENIL